MNSAPTAVCPATARALAAALLALSLVLPRPATAEGALRYAFELPPGPDGTSAAGGYACRPQVEPLVDLSGMFAFYKSTKGQSDIDRRRMQAYVDRIGLAKDLVRSLSIMSFDAVDRPAERAAIRACILDALRPWAEAGAMLGGLDENTPLGERQATLEIVWTGIAIANAMALAEEVEPLDEADRALFHDWLRGLADQVMDNFTERPRDPDDRWLNSRTNQWYWAGAAVAAFAVHLDDRRAFYWAMGILFEALDHAPEDGGLPREIRRGKRALHYQNYALVALAQLVEFAAENGVDLGPERWKKIAAIARFTADAYEDPSALEARTGRAQEKDPGMLRWVAPLTRRFEERDPALAARLAALQPPIETWGNRSCTWVCIPLHLDVEEADE